MLQREWVTGFFEAMNRRDLEGLGRFLDEDAEFFFPKAVPLIGRKKTLSFFAILFRQYPTLRFAVRRVLMDGSAAAVHWTNSGVNRKGEPYENEGVTLLEVGEGGIRFLSDFFKDTGKF